MDSNHQESIAMKKESPLGKNNYTTNIQSHL